MRCVPEHIHQSRRRSPGAKRSIIRRRTSGPPTAGRCVIGSEASTRCSRAPTSRSSISTTSRGIHPTKVYAVIDGKQRLHAIWVFVAGDVRPRRTFVLEAEPDLSRPPASPAPPGMRWNNLDSTWRSTRLGTLLSVVLVQRATE